MKTSTIIITGIAASIAILPIKAIADNHTGKRGGMMLRADTNKDGKVSRDEALKMATDRFERADKDKNGEISLDEMIERIERSRLERRAKRMLARMDFNGDGKVTKDEVENRAQKRFALADRNDDGFIEKSEMRKSRRHMRGEKRRMRKERRRDERNRGGDEL